MYNYTKRGAKYRTNRAEIYRLLDEPDKAEADEKRARELDVQLGENP